MEVNKIYNADCVEFMKTIDNESIDITITSPPYDNLRKYEWYSFDFEWTAKELYRITKEWWVVVWVVNDATIDWSESWTSFRQALYFKEVWFNLHDTMIYEKNTSTFPAKRTSNRYTQIFEYMFVFSKGKPKTAKLICDKKNIRWWVTTWGVSHNRNSDDKLVPTDKKTTIAEYSPRNNIWQYKVWRSANHWQWWVSDHPAVFPIQLVKDHLLSWSNEWDTVLDCFMWSWTTALACRELNRNFIWIEISPKYCEIANKRISDLFT